MSTGGWHPGELVLQRLAGSEDRLAAQASRILAPYMTEQLRAFFPRLPFVAVGFVDEDLQPWGTLLPGNPGFAWSPEPTILRIDRAPPVGDPLAKALRPGASLGLLGIELPTRRRNRVNGLIVDCDASGFTLKVEQAFGNCPKYIQQRNSVGMALPPARIEVEQFDKLEDRQARELLSQADTMFVATYAPGPDGNPSIDISHRGGRPGFVRLDADGALTIPDFSGNGFFNTLGNIFLTRRAGLVVPCFQTRDLLLLTGDACVQANEMDSGKTTSLPGAERFWRIIPRAGCWLRRALPLEWQMTSWSPHTLATGAWPDLD